MPRYVALLRGINVGGHRKIAMAALREFLSGLGLDGVRTLLQTGNVVFESPARPPAPLETLLEQRASEQLGLDTLFYVRSAPEWARILAGNPFPGPARDDPAHLAVHLLKQAPAAERVRELRAAIKGRESVRVVDRQAYIVYPDGMGRSKLTLTLLDRTLGRGTARNWNTVRKLGEMIA